MGREIDAGVGRTSATLIFLLFLLLPTRASANSPPAPTSNPRPVNGQTGVPLDPQLCATVSDPEGSPLSVTFYGREVAPGTATPFTIIALPDTQYYAASYPTTFTAQTSWIRDNLVS